MAEHYAGDDTNVRTLAAGVLAAYAGISVDDFEAKSDAFLRSATASDSRSRISRMRLHADGRAARLPGRERVLQLHRSGAAAVGDPEPDAHPGRHAAGDAEAALPELDDVDQCPSKRRQSVMTW